MQMYRKVAYERLLYAVVAGVFVFCFFLVSPADAQIEMLGPIDTNSQQGSSKHSKDDDDSVNLAKSKYTPTNLTAQARGENLVELHWKDHAKKEDGYTIERRSNHIGWHNVGYTGKNSESYVDHTVVSGTTYTYRVAAFDNKRQTAWSKSVTVKTPGLSPAQKIARAKQQAAEEEKKKLEKEFDTVLKTTVEKEVEKTRKEILSAVPDQHCTLAQVPATEVDRAFRLRCKQLTGEDHFVGDTNLKESFWDAFLHNTKMRLAILFIIFFIILNNVIWHITHKTVKNRMRGEF